ncbi:MAG: 1-deoxy-D-xylulose-5-phosphate synthase [Planctomycetota bacterium]
MDAIDTPVELKRLSSEQLPELAAELRAKILYTIQRTGGHLGSGMGAVELTIALHYLFDFKDDRLIFDVGHQAYPHKLLTGRKARFHTIRQKGGLSGFTNRFESDYDVYLMGHAGTAASAALGVSVGDRLLGRKRNVVAVVGDAAMGCGVAFEALNHAGGLEGERLLVVLNDNRWSIAQTVGALSRHLNRIRSGPLYNQAKRTLHNLLQSIPLIGKDLDDRLDAGVQSLRNILAPGSVFDELGCRYFGPVDGHSLPDLLDVLGRVKDLDGVVLLHVRTEKGRGVPGSEERYDRAHAAKPKAKPVPAEPQVVLPAKAKRTAAAWTDWFGEAVEDLAARDPRVVAITAAMPDGTGLLRYRDKFPERFVDAGIAEQHAVAFASGLATAGSRPVVAIYSTFLQRAYDQVFQEVLIQNVPVMFCMDRAGIAGEDGCTHNGLHDIAYLRTMPNIVLMAPKDGPELRAMMDFALAHDGPTGIRYARGVAPDSEDLRALGWNLPTSKIELGKMEVLRKGKDGAILACGHMAKTALEAARILEGHGIDVEVVNARFVKPIDQAGVVALAQRHDLIVTLEDHAVAGGFGSAVLETLASGGPCRARIQLMGVPDRFLDHGSREEMLAEVGLDARAVVERFLATSSVASH